MYNIYRKELSEKFSRSPKHLDQKLIAVCSISKNAQRREDGIKFFRFNRTVKNGYPFVDAQFAVQFPAFVFYCNLGFCIWSALHPLHPFVASPLVHCKHECPTAWDGIAHCEDAASRCPNSTEIVTSLGLSLAFFCLFCLLLQFDQAAFTRIYLVGDSRAYGSMPTIVLFQKSTYKVAW